MTQDQNLIVVTYADNKDTDLYENTGYGYQIKQ